MTAVSISSPGGTTSAEFAPDANLVCTSLRHAGLEFLDPGRGVAAYAERGKTMGIPLLYPWANRLSAPEFTAAGRSVALGGTPGVAYPVDPNHLPIHGAMPGRLRWELADQAGDALRARLAWERPELLALFPFRHHAEVEARVGDGSLTLTTSVHADGSDAVPVSFGYHPYLTLPGSARSDWRVVLGAAEHLTLDERMLPTGGRTPVAERELELGTAGFDDGYTGLAGPGGGRFAVSHGGRSIAVSFGAGYEWAQVYAPPEHDFICFEPMTAPANALRSGDGLTVIAPGESYTASFTVTLAA